MNFTPTLIRQNNVVGTYKPYPTKFHICLDKFVFIPTRICWVSNLHGHSSSDNWVVSFIVESHLWITHHGYFVANRAK